MTTEQEVESLTYEQLERNLITCDFRGRQFKKLCLDELLMRQKFPIENKDV